MLFNSFTFILLFTPLLLVGLWTMRRYAQPVAAQALLLAASLLFYAWGKPSSLLLLGVSILFNFTTAKAMSKASQPKGRERVFLLGLMANLLFLGVLKYARFAQSILFSLTGLNIPVPGIGLPLGVSFFTIQQIMYLVDCYENLCPANSLFDHASFVAFFPCLTSGPLVRSRQIVPQLKLQRMVSAEDFTRGLTLFAFGLFKKVVIADCIGRVADAGFDHLGMLSGAEAWISCSVYCLQIYFDFSGYSDMAVGVGRMLGLTIPVNFNAPYRSLSIIEFWQRWHISLSQFITTYLFTPLIRSMGKATLVTSALATLGAMAIAGLWHGPAWTYILFGLIHGMALVLNQVWRKRVKLALPPALSWTLTMVPVFVAFVFFRSVDLPAALRMFKALFMNAHVLGFDAFRNVIRMADIKLLAVPVLLALPLAVVGLDSNEWVRRAKATRWSALGLAALLAVCFLFLNSTIAQGFVYFAF